MGVGQGPLTVSPASAVGDLGSDVGGVVSVLGQDDDVGLYETEEQASGQVPAAYLKQFLRGEYEGMGHPHLVGRQGGKLLGLQPGAHVLECRGIPLHAGGGVGVGHCQLVQHEVHALDNLAQLFP